MLQQLLSLRRDSPTGQESSDLHGTLLEIEPSLRQHLRGGQSLVFSLEAEKPLVAISADQIDHVVRNLVLNARDAMPEGGTITIATKRGKATRASQKSIPVVLEIRDTGIGMDVATRQRLFEPFFTTKSKDEGMGLGLSMVQLIVEGAGGTIQVESAPGWGTTFCITLPSPA